MTLIGGQLVATLVLVILQQFLSDGELRAWGWRIPFLIGAIAAVIAFYLRRSLAETSAREHKEAGSVRGMLRYPRSFFVVMGFTAAGSLSFYAFTTYMQKYLVNSAGFDARHATEIMTAALFVFMILQPAFGSLADIIGRRTNMLIYTVFLMIVTVPIFTAIGHASSSGGAFLLIMAAMLCVSFYTSISGCARSASASLTPSPMRSSAARPSTWRSGSSPPGTRARSSGTS